MDNQIRELSKKNERKRMLKRAISLLCVIVLLFTMNTLKRNANTLERIPMCGMEEHIHEGACYNEAGELVCGRQEHVHTDACYQESPKKKGKSGDLDVSLDGFDNTGDLIDSGDVQSLDLSTDLDQEGLLYNATDSKGSRGSDNMMEKIDGDLLSDIPKENAQESQAAVANNAGETQEVSFEFAGEVQGNAAQTSSIANAQQPDAIAEQPADDGQQEEAPAVAGQPADDGQQEEEPAVAGQPVTDDGQQEEEPAVAEQPADDGQQEEAPAVAGQPADDGQQEEEPAVAGQPASDDQEPVVVEQQPTSDDDQEEEEPAVAGQPVMDDDQKEEEPAVGEQPALDDQEPAAVEQQPTSDDDQKEEEPAVGEQPTDDDQQEEQPAVGEQPADDDQQEEAPAVGEQLTDDGQQEEQPAVAEQPTTDDNQKEEEPAVGEQPANEGQQEEEPAVAGQPETNDDQQEEEPAVDGQPDEAENHEAQSAERRYTATVDLAETKTYPISLRGMIANAVPAEDIEVVADDAGEQPASAEAAELPVDKWSIEFDSGLFALETADDDILITPQADFESAEIIISNGSRYELTLTHCALEQAEDASAPETEPEIARPAQHFEQATDYISVVVDAPEGAFPEGTVMVVRDVVDQATINNIEQSVTEDFVEVKSVHAVDISFWYNDVEIEPSLPITVVMSAMEVEKQQQTQDAVVVHVADDGDAKVVDSEKTGTAEASLEMPAGDPASQTFEADTFSVYALVFTEKIETKYIDDSGETWSIKVNFTEKARIPANATLKVSEVTDESYLAEAEAALESGKRITKARFFDIRIMDGDREVQPEDTVQVIVSLEGDEGTVEPDPEAPKATEVGDPEVCAMHFVEKNDEVVKVETMDATETKEGVTFDADGFSVWGVVYTVEFHNGDAEVIIQGGSQVLLGTLIERLGLARANGDSFTVDEVERVEFDDEELFTVEEVTESPVLVNDEKVELATDHDFLITSKGPFDATKMRLTLTDGEVIVVEVTDDQQYTATLNFVEEGGAPVESTGLTGEYYVMISATINNEDWYSVSDGSLDLEQKTGTVTFSTFYRNSDQKCEHPVTALHNGDNNKDIKDAWLVSKTASGDKPNVYQACEPTNSGSNVKKIAIGEMLRSYLLSGTPSGGTYTITASKKQPYTVVSSFPAGGTLTDAYYLVAETEKDVYNNSNPLSVYYVADYDPANPTDVFSFYIDRYNPNPVTYSTDMDVNVFLVKKTGSMYSPWDAVNATPIGDGDAVEQYKLSYDTSTPNQTTLNFTASSDVFISTVKFYGYDATVIDATQTVPLHVDPSVSTEAQTLTKHYYLLAMVKDGNTLVGWAVKPIDPNNHGETPASFLEFYPCDPAGVVLENQEMIPFKASNFGHTIQTRLLHSDSAIDETNLNYQYLVTNGQEHGVTEKPEDGYEYAGNWYPNANDPTHNEIHMKKAYDKKYAIRVRFVAQDDSELVGIAQDKYYYAFVTVEHENSTVKEYWYPALYITADQIKALPTDENHYHYLDIELPAGKWLDQNGDPIEDFTGNEKRIKVELVQSHANDGSMKHSEYQNATKYTEGGSLDNYAIHYDTKDVNPKSTNSRFFEVKDSTTHTVLCYDRIDLTMPHVESEYDYSTILGPNYAYGIVADHLFQNNDLQTNFAVNHYTGHGDYVTPDLSGSSSGTIVIGEFNMNTDIMTQNHIGAAITDMNSTDPEIVKAGTLPIGSHLTGPLAIYVDNDTGVNYGETGFPVNDTSNHYAIVQRVDGATLKQNIVDPAIQYGVNMSRTLVSKQAAYTPVIPEDGKPIIDTTGFAPNATIYIDADRLLKKVESSEGIYGDLYALENLKINKHDGQMLVFNFKETKNVRLCQIRVKQETMYGASVDGDGYFGTNTTVSQSATNNLMDDLSRHIVWNLNSCTGRVEIKEGGGIYLQPNHGSETRIGATSGGWLVSNGYVYNDDGEWHNFYAEMPANTTVNLMALKSVDGHVPNARFDFQLYEYTGGSPDPWTTVQDPKQNNAGKVSWTINDPADGWHVYMIKETSLADGNNGSYILDTKEYYAAVQVISRQWIEGDTVHTGKIAGAPAYYENFDANGWMPGSAAPTGLANPISMPEFKNQELKKGLTLKKTVNGSNSAAVDFTFRIEAWRDATDTEANQAYKSAYPGAQTVPINGTEDVAYPVTGVRGTTQITFKADTTKHVSYATLTLRNGQAGTIGNESNGLPQGAHYRIYEIKVGNKDIPEILVDSDQPVYVDGYRPHEVDGTTHKQKAIEGTINAQGNLVTFENDYSASGTLELKGHKALVNRTASGDQPVNNIPANAFGFQLVEGDVLQTVYNTSEGNVAFAPITYTSDDMVGATEYEDGTRSKIILYTVHEIDGSADIDYSQIINDEDQIIKVKLVDDGKGTITAKVLKDDGEGNIIETDPEEFTFDFTNLKGIQTWILGSKRMIGRGMKANEAFTFVLEENNTEVSHVTVTGVADGGVKAFRFPAINYTRKDIGTHVYTVREVIPDDKGDVVYDGHSFTATVVVKEEDGQLVAEGPTYEGERTFINYSDESVTVEKDWSNGNEYHPDDKIKVQLYKAYGEDVPAGSVPAEGTGPAAYTGSGNQGTDLTGGHTISASDTNYLPGGAVPVSNTVIVLSNENGWKYTWHGLPKMEKVENTWKYVTFYPVEIWSSAEVTETSYAALTNGTRVYKVVITNTVTERLGALKLKKVVTVNDADQAIRNSGDTDYENGPYASVVDGAYDFKVTGPLDETNRMVKYVRIHIMGGHIGNVEFSDDGTSFGNTVNYDLSDKDRWAVITDLTPGRYEIEETGAYKRSGNGLQIINTARDDYKLKSITSSAGAGDTATRKVIVTVYPGDTAEAWATFTNNFEIVSISAQKIWKDDNTDDEPDDDGADIEFELQSKVGDGAWTKVDGSSIGDNNPKTIHTNDNWTATWNKLPKYQGSTEIEYRVLENKLWYKGTNYYVIWDGDDYTVRKGSPEGELCDSWLIAKAIDPDTGMFIFTNTLKGALKLTKTVTVNGGAPVKDVDNEVVDRTYVFTVAGVEGTATEEISHTIEIEFRDGVVWTHRIDGGDNVSISDSDKSNSWSVLLTDLVPGDYTITETEVPSMDTTVSGGKEALDNVVSRTVTVTVTAGDTAAERPEAQAAFTNDKAVGALKIRKVVLDHGDETTDAVKDGAYDFSIARADDTGNPVKYVRIFIYEGIMANYHVSDSLDNLGTAWENYDPNDADRWAYVRNLDPGDYVIKEIRACAATDDNAVTMALTTPLTGVYLESITGGKLTNGENDANVDDGTVTVTVVAGDAGGDQASAKVTYYNTTPYVVVPFKAKKTYEGGTLTEGQFEFVLTETDSGWTEKQNGITQTKTNAAPANGSNWADVLFEDVKLTEAGAYYFTVTETATGTGIVYDAHTQYIKVDVTQNATAGKLTAVKSYKTDPAGEWSSTAPETGYDAAFVNRKVSLELKKIVEADTNIPVYGKKEYTNGTYTFTITGPSGNDSKTYTVVITMEDGVMMGATLAEGGNAAAAITASTANATFDATNGVRLLGLTPGAYTVTEGTWTISNPAKTDMYLKDMTVSPVEGNTVDKATKTATVTVSDSATVAVAYTNILEPNEPNLEKQVTNLNDSVDNPTATFVSESPWNKSADFDIGDLVPYRITTFIPNGYYRAQTAYTYIIHDTMNHLEYDGADGALTDSQGYTGSGRMYAFVKSDTDGDTGAWYDVSKWFSVGVGAYADGQQTITVYPTNDNDLKTVLNGYKVTNWQDADTHGDKYPYKEATCSTELTAGINADIRYLQFRYKAELKGDALVGLNQGNPNTAYLTYTNAPGSTDNTKTDTNIVYTYKLVVDKADENGAPLSGAKFQLFKKYEDGNPFAPTGLGTGLTSGSITFYGLDSAVTSVDTSKILNGGIASSIAGKYYRVDPTSPEDGADASQYVWNGLDDGWYILIETKAPDGYKALAEPIAMDVTTKLKTKEPGYFSGYVSVHPDAEAIIDLFKSRDIKTSAQIKVEVPNEPYGIDIKIEKVSSGETPLPLSGAVFKLTKYMGTNSETNAENWVAVSRVETSNVDSEGHPVLTDDEGKFTVNGNITLKDLRDGRYKLEETASPTGYVITNRYPVEFTIKDGEVVSDSNVLKTGVTYTPKRPATDSQEAVDTDTFTITNDEGAALPATGGSGTGWIYAAGASLMLLAALGLILICRRRREGAGIR